MAPAKVAWVARSLSPSRTIFQRPSPKGSSLLRRRRAIRRIDSSLFICRMFWQRRACFQSAAEGFWSRIPAIIRLSRSRREALVIVAVYVISNANDEWYAAYT